MGLIAVVYRAPENLPFDMSTEGAERDERSGAIYFRDAEKKKRFPREQRQAIRIKLGTSYDIADITRELAPLLGSAESILSARVLYDISHSGDIIETSELVRMKQELHGIEERLGSRTSKVTTKFFRDMFALLKAAEGQKNPIVFV